jgi:ATP-dependent DNA helicase RecG
LKETQNIEFKSSWRDEYLKHICAFSNSNGGDLYIGVDDCGNIIGITDGKKLLEDIPNKTVNFLGIIVDVQLKHQDINEYLKITVTPSSVPISYKGNYYVKSGTTKQELKGQELHSFLMKKLGHSFDDLPAEGSDFF